MKKLILFIAFMMSTPVFAGPITKIVSLMPVYNSDFVQIEWENSINGGCLPSNEAYTNPAAINQNELTAYLLAAMVAQLDVEVIFGGGCQYEKNWIQTIKVKRKR